MKIFGLVKNPDADFEYYTVVTEHPWDYIQCGGRYIKYQAKFVQRDLQTGKEWEFDCRDFDTLEECKEFAYKKAQL